jgi:hypothetical protein
MNKYRSAMKKIVTTPQMEDRILRNLSCKKEPTAENKKQSYNKWFRPVAAVAVCFVIILGVMAIYPSLMNLNRNNQQISDPNPIVDTKEIDALKKAVTFELRVPETLPIGYKIDMTSVISGKLAQIIYTDGNNEITFRAVKGIEDISGDHTVYEDSEVVKISNAEVVMKGNKSLIHLATWAWDDYSYSLSFSAGIEKEAVLSIIENMKKA